MNESTKDIEARDQSARQIVAAPATPVRHREQHFTSSETVRDVVIGMSDGLTVPFAIAAGMTGAAVGTHVVIIAGLAEIAAGSISMGLGGYLAGRTDVEHYDAERQREETEVDTVPQVEKHEVRQVLEDFGLDKPQAASVTEAMSKDKSKWVEFMMRFELGLEKPDPKRALQSALTIALSYAFSGLIPLAPYVIVGSLTTALYVSVAFTLIALFVFGYFKGRVTGVNALISAVQTTLIGGAAAGAAFTIARLIG